MKNEARQPWLEHGTYGLEGRSKVSERPREPSTSLRNSGFSFRQIQPDSDGLGSLAAPEPAPRGSYRMAIVDEAASTEAVA